MVKAFLMTSLGLFALLFGMAILRDGLQRYFGDRFHAFLQRTTKTPLRGFLSGAVLTGLLQSSTALTVMTITFVDGGLLSFRNALGLILGSNVGSTLTPQLLAFAPGEFSVPFIFFGLIGFLLSPKKKKDLFLAIAGLGLMFFSLDVLSEAMLPFMETGWIKNWLTHMEESYLQSILAGTVVSALLHSSSAATGIVMVLIEEGWLSLPASFAFIFGANIGTCFTALMVSYFTSRSAQRVAIFHVLLNVFGVLIFYPFIQVSADLIASLGGTLTRQVANAHTLFNLLSSLVALPLLPVASRLLERIR